MIKKASGKIPTGTKKKASVKRRTGPRAAAKGQASASSKGVVATRTTTKKRAPAKKGASARRGPAPEARSSALELEELFNTTQSRLVMAWQKEADAAVKALVGLQRKLERAVERQRKLRDKRVAAVTRDKEKRSAATGARREKAKQTYTEATAVVVELRALATAARARTKATKLGLARALARGRILARFARNYDKAQAAKTKGTRRKTRKTAQRESPTGESVPNAPGADEKQDESTPAQVEQT